MTRYIFRNILAIIFALAATNIVSAEGPPIAPETAGVRTRGADPVQLAEEKPKVVDWGLLVFDQNRMIKRIRVKLYKHMFAEPHRIAVVDIDSDDTLVLAHITAGLSNGLMFTPRPGNWGWGSLPFGELEIVTNKDSFKIYFDSKFVLGAEHLQNGNGFVSWTVAKAISDLLREKTGNGLTVDRFEGLSGERWLRAERENFRKRAGGTKADK